MGRKESTEYLSRVDGERGIKIYELRVDGDGELRMRQRNERRVANDDKGTYSGQEERDRYIESEERHTKTERAREVRDRASPDRSRETDGSSGIDLTREKEEGQKGVGSGMGIVAGKALTRRQGVRGFGSALMRRELARDEARGFGMRC